MKIRIKVAWTVKLEKHTLKLRARVGFMHFFT